MRHAARTDANHREMLAFEVRLPWPPSVNKYWRYVGSKPLISEKGRAYRKEVIDVIFELSRQMKMSLNHLFPASSRIAVVIVACPPDRRRRDLDNLLKAPLDALTHAGLWEDDEQIDELKIIRRGIEKPGRLYVGVQEIALVNGVRRGEW